MMPTFTFLSKRRSANKYVQVEEMRLQVWSRSSWSDSKGWHLMWMTTKQIEITTAVVTYTGLVM